MTHQYKFFFFWPPVFKRITHTPVQLFALRLFTCNTLLIRQFQLIRVQFVSLFDLQKKQRAEKRRFSSSEEEEKKKRGSFKQRRLQLSDTAEEEEEQEEQTEAPLPAGSQVKCVKSDLKDSVSVHTVSNNQV